MVSNTVVFLVLTNIWLAKSEFNPLLPFTTNNNCLINIVLSTPWKNIPIHNQSTADGLLHTYTIHTVSSLNFKIPEKYIEGNKNAFDMTTGYFRLSSKYCKCSTVFLTFTQDIFELVNIIQNSGFGTSDRVMFFNYFAEIAKSIAKINKVLEYLPQLSTKPFHVGVIFFEFGTDRVYLMCYFCNLKFGQLRPTVDRSLSSLQQVHVAHSLNGYGQTIQIYYTLSEVINMYADQFSDILPVDSCIEEFGSHHGDLKSLLKSLCKCNRKIFLAISTLQNVLNVSWTLKNSNEFELPPKQQEKKWQLQFRLSIRLLLPLEDITFITLRGNQHTYLDVLHDYFKFAVCVNYDTYTTYDLALLTIVDWQTWIALFASCFVISYVTHSWMKGFSVFKFSLGLGINEIGFDRRLLWCFLIPMTFYSNIYQSYISSESTYLPDLPHSFEWYVYQNFKIAFPFKHAIEFVYSYLLPQDFKSVVKTILSDRNVWNYVSSEDIPITNISHMAQQMTEKKIGIGNYFEKYTFFTSLLNTNYALIDGKYACLLRKISWMAETSTVSIRFTGYLSKRTDWVFSNWMETGEFIKFDRLSRHTLSLKRSWSTAKVIYLDKAAPMQAIGLKSIVGLSCYILFGAGTVFLVVGFLASSLHYLVSWLTAIFYYIVVKFIEKLLVQLL